MKNALWIIVAVIIIGGGIWWWTSSNDSITTSSNTAVNENASSNAPVDHTATTTTPVPTATDPMVPPMALTVIYDGNAFTPANGTVKKGGTITFKNSSGKNMWVASDEHPTHTEYDGTSRSTHCAPNYTGSAPFDQCKGGGDYSFTFPKIGKSDFHDHLNPGAHGSITIVE